MGIRQYAGRARGPLGSLFAGCALLLAPAALATPASAASLSVTKACYAFTKNKLVPMTLSGAGFVPGGQVTINSSDGWIGDAGVIVGLTGSFSTSVPVPEPSFELPGQKTVTLTAEEFTLGGTITATTPVTVAPLDAAVVPGQAPLSHKVTWYLSGFAPGKYIYVHYLHGTPVARMRLGRAKGACGVLKARAPLYPSLHPRYRRYPVQIDDARRYSKHATPRLERTLKLFFQ
jgi:hypothetical protein